MTTSSRSTPSRTDRPDRVTERVLTLLSAYPGLRLEHVAWALDLSTPRVLTALQWLVERGFVVPDHRYYLGGWAATAWDPNAEPTLDGFPADWPLQRGPLPLDAAAAHRLGYLTQRLVGV